MKLATANKSEDKKSDSQKLRPAPKPSHFQTPTAGRAGLPRFLGGNTGFDSPQTSRPLPAYMASPVSSTITAASNAAPNTQPLHPMLQLQQQAGSQAMQEPPRNRAIQAKMAISQPHDPDEREADHVADRIMRSHAGDPASAPCSCSSGGMCEKCQQKQATISRRASSSAAPADIPHVVSDTLRSPGRPLDSSTRSFFEPHFGQDFSKVRVHTDRAAQESARSIQAHAYTAGEHVVFGREKYAPETESGRYLIAHELTHVVQQDGASVIHRQHGATKQETAPPQKTFDWHPGMFAKVVKEFLGYKASGMGTYKVGEILEVTSDIQTSGVYNEVQVVSAALPGLPRGTYLSWVGVENLVPTEPPARIPYLQIPQLLQDPQQNRAALPGGFDVQSPQMVSRPAGLPLDGSYTLQELPWVPPNVAAQIPEGGIVTLSQDSLEGKPPAADRSSWLLPGLGGGSWAGLRGADEALMKFGLAPAGDFAIGLVAIPPAAPNPFSRYPNLTALENPFEWAGHTAVYVRQGGQITIVRGYNPKMRWGEPSTIWDMLKDYRKIFGGKKGVAGDITEDFGMFRSTSARTVEYPVTPEVAAEFLGTLPPLGTPAPGDPPLYSAPPSTYATTSGTQVGCEGTNCGLWATQKVEGPLGARFGVAGQEPIVDIPVPGQAAQGKIYGIMDPASRTPLVEMPGATGSPTVGGVSNGLRVLKWGGRIFVVAGGIKLGYDIATAPEGERAHVAFVGGSGFVGGFVGGAALGLVCGPGAPVCSVVTGIVGGIAGALGAGELAEDVWNFPQTARMANEVIQDLEEQRLQQLVRKSGGTMPPGVQDAARRSGVAIFFAH